MDAPTFFSWASASYIALQSSLLLLAPGLIVNMLAPDPRRPSDLETYLSRSLGLAGFALAAILLPLTGAVPVAATNSPYAHRNLYAYPSVLVISAYHTACATYIYMHTFSPVGAATPLGAVAGMVVSSFLACVGLWTVMFGEEAGKISKTTGADKRTSAYPFENSEAAREKKKSLRRES